MNWHAYVVACVAAFVLGAEWDVLRVPLDAAGRWLGRWFYREAMEPFRYQETLTRITGAPRASYQPGGVIAIDREIGDRLNRRAQDEPRWRYMMTDTRGDWSCSPDGDGG